MQFSSNVADTKRPTEATTSTYRGSVTTNICSGIILEGFDEINLENLTSNPPCSGPIELTSAIKISEQTSWLHNLDYLPLDQCKRELKLLENETFFLDSTMKVENFIDYKQTMSNHD